MSPGAASDAERGQLPEAELRGLFDEDVLPVVFAAAAPTPGGGRPVAVIVGGQPGSGKGAAVRRAVGRHPGSVEIIGDDLRAYHPLFGHLLDTRPLAMPDATAAASGRWVQMCLAHAVATRTSLVVETTLRNRQTLVSTATKLRAGGFAVEVQVLAVPPTVSLLATVTRYVTQLEDKGTGRWTPLAAHQDAVAGADETLSAALRAGVLDSVEVITRRGEVQYRGIDAAGVLSAVNAGRSRRLSAAEGVGWVDDLVRCASLLLRGGNDVHEVRQVFHALTDIGASVVRDLPTVHQPRALSLLRRLELDLQARER